MQVKSVKLFSTQRPNCNRKIFVYNICLISISDTVSDGATKTLVLNIERAQHD